MHWLNTLNLNGKWRLFGAWLQPKTASQDTPASDRNLKGVACASDCIIRVLMLSVLNNSLSSTTVMIDLIAINLHRRLGRQYPPRELNPGPLDSLYKKSVVMRLYLFGYTHRQFLVCLCLFCLRIRGKYNINLQCSSFSAKKKIWKRSVVCLYA